VRRLLLVVPLLAALLFLPGCFWWMAPIAMSGSESEESGEYVPADDPGMSSVRSAIPAIEAYYADNGTYKGATLEALQQYDAALHGIKVAKANDQTYCIESDVGGFPWFKAGPAAQVQPGDCSTKPLAPTPPDYGAETNVRAVVPAIEAYYADHGSYAGVTDDILRRYDPFLPKFTLVRRSKDSYCIESTADGVTFHKAGPSADVAQGGC
jgi:hypothetical protein